MAQRKRIYLSPTDSNAEAFIAAAITLPAKYEIVNSIQEADFAARDLMPSGTLASWTTSFFVADAQIGQEDLSEKTIEISIERAESLSSEERQDEARSVLQALGVLKLESEKITSTTESLLIGGIYRGSAVSIAHRIAQEPLLRIFISDLKLRLSLRSPLGKTAAPAEIERHTSKGTEKLRPSYRSVISRLLADN
jgi:hypothetical protein